MSVRISQVDAFTSEPFAGNPAGVCVLSTPRPDRWMQQVAREMNLAETAFLHPHEDGGYALRWFTPTDEVDLCGHATLASAHVLWTEGHCTDEAPVVFHTRSGRLVAEQRGDWIAMDFPAEPLVAAEPPPVLEADLGAAPAWVGRNRMDYGVLLEDEAAVRELAPDLSRLAAIEARGVIVTAPAADAEEYDFVSRFFAPRVGVPEDPVTGSAHCALGPFWTGRLGRTDLVARQVSTRGGTVRVKMADAGSERLLLMGQAVSVLHAELTA